ncbi:uncharacterized protein LOC126912466 [Spodoptera frugiperda]|uniref:Uncharacterized protein LOC126912466 n=1 Tax=Spodoptera frugiperda TaxID=7108 RepID=A0A9R0F4T7_SPOFR|nr:uncharacterized protein LOC126912466 [Spodoptera frugiperda]
MKAEARKRLWFPGVDAALDRVAGACTVCAALRPAPPHAPLAPWPLPPHPNSKNSTTDKSPAELVFGRSLRSRLDLLNPNAPSSSTSTDLTQTVARKQSLQAKHFRGVLRPEFKDNDLVWITKNTNNNKVNWLEGIITKKIGNLMYSVYVPQLNGEVTRHMDQIRKRLSSPISSATGEDQDWDPDVIPDVASPATTHPEPATHREGEGEATTVLEPAAATPPGTPETDH